MVLTHEGFNSRVTDFVGDVERAARCFAGPDPSIGVEFASADSERLRAVVEAKINLLAPESASGELAQLLVNYKLCADSYGDYVAVEHSTFVLRAKLDRAPIIRWDFDRRPRRKPSSHVQVTAHRGALSHLLSRLEHPNPHTMEALHIPMGGERFRPCLEDVVEFLIRDCGFSGSSGWEETVRNGRAKWRRIQTGAVVRDSPESAAAELEAMGYQVNRPSAGPVQERIDRLTAW